MKVLVGAFNQENLSDCEIFAKFRLRRKLYVSLILPSLQLQTIYTIDENRINLLMVENSDLFSRCRSEDFFLLKIEFSLSDRSPME